MTYFVYDVSNILENTRGELLSLCSDSSQSLSQNRPKAGEGLHLVAMEAQSPWPTCDIEEPVFLLLSGLPSIRPSVSPSVRLSNTALIPSFEFLSQLTQGIWRLS